VPSGRPEGNRPPVRGHGARYSAVSTRAAGWRHEHFRAESRMQPREPRIFERNPHATTPDQYGHSFFFSSADAWPRPADNSILLAVFSLQLNNYPVSNIDAALQRRQSFCAQGILLLPLCHLAYI